MRARSALFTLFGDVVRPSGGQAWLTSLTAAMDALGFTPEATRTALHRMAAEGWVAPRRVGRYATYQLTPRGEDRLEEAAARIYRLRAAPWDGCWRLLVADPEPEAARALAWMGFGRLRDGVWVSPSDHGDRLPALFAEHGLEATVFAPTAATQAGADADIVARAWDLSALRAAHEAFLARWAARVCPADDREAFAARARLVHHWRSFLFLDPGLPQALLPADWRGDEAATLFRARYDEVADAGWRWWTGVAASAPGAAA